MRILTFNVLNFVEETLEYACNFLLLNTEMVPVVEIPPLQRQCHYYPVHGKYYRQTSNIRRTNFFLLSEA